MITNEELKQFFSEFLGKQDGIIGRLDKLVEVGPKGIDDTFCEVYNVTATTTEQTVRPAAIDGKRLAWDWVHLENRGDTNNVKVQINGDSDEGIVIKPGGTKTIDWKNLKVKYIMYEAEEDTTTLQIVGLRPEAKIEPKKAK